MKPKFLFALLICVIFNTGCIPTEVIAIKTNGQKVVSMFYPGGSYLDDLLIIEGKNYFGKAQYSINDPLGDIGFRFKSGERFTAECSLTGKDIIGQLVCKKYVIVRSTFIYLPEKTDLLRPLGI